MSLISLPVFTSGFPKKIYPLKLCIELDEPTSDFFQWLLRDVAFLHSVLLATCAFDDISKGQPLAKATRFHLQRTLSLLNKKLSEREACCNDLTIYIVITLALMASLFGEHAAAETHLAGLHQIIELAGGLGKLRQKPKLHFTIDR